jgi:hypothetical protein
MRTAAEVTCTPVSAGKSKTKPPLKAKTPKANKKSHSALPVAVEIDSGASTNLILAASPESTTVTEVTNAAADVATIAPDATTPTATDPGITVGPTVPVAAVFADSAESTEHPTPAVLDVTHTFAFHPDLRVGPRPLAGGFLTVALNKVNSFSFRSSFDML